LGNESKREREARNEENHFIFTQGFVSDFSTALQENTTAFTILRKSATGKAAFCYLVSHWMNF
jgi:hypothetical protein